MEASSWDCLTRKTDNMVLVQDHRLKDFGLHGEIHYIYTQCSFTLIFLPAVLAVNRAARDAMVTGMMMQCKKG